MSQEFDKDIEQEELDLFAQNLDIDETPVPAELEEKIRARMEKVRRHPKLMLKLASVAAAIVVLFVGGIKTSPAFAGYMSNVPLIGGAVQWLQGDSGIRRASENGYKNLGPVVVSKDEVTVTLDNIYVDEDRIRLSIAAEGERIKDESLALRGITSLTINKTDVKPTDSTSASGPKSMYTRQPYVLATFPEFDAGGVVQESKGFNGKKIETVVEKKFGPGELKKFLDQNRDSGILVRISINKGDENITSFGTIIPCSEKDVRISREYEQHADIKIEHGSVSVDRLTVSPTRIRLDVSFDMDPGYFFTGFENPELWDEEGNVYKSEGLVSSKWDGNTRSLYMVPSLYFDKLPEKLYFSFNGIRIGAEEGRTFEVRLDETFPRKISYMGREVTIENAEYNKEGQLEVSYSLADEKLLDLNGLELCGDNGDGRSTIYSEKGSNDDKHIYWFKSIFKVDNRDSYQLKFEYPGYLIKKSGTCKLELVESDR